MFGRDAFGVLAGLKASIVMEIMELGVSVSELNTEP